MSKAIKNKLSAQLRDESLSKLKSRFEKNMNRHKGLEWSKVKVRLEADSEKLRALCEIEKTDGDPMWLATIKKPGNTYFMIVRRKAPKAAEVFVMTIKHWRPEKNINPKIALFKWLPIWA